MLKEESVVYFNVMSHNFSRIGKYIREIISQARLSTSSLKIEGSISRIQIKDYTLEVDKCVGQINIF